MDRKYKTGNAKPNPTKKVRNAKREMRNPLILNANLLRTMEMGIEITPRVQSILSRPRVDMGLVMLELTAITNTRSLPAEYQKLDARKPVSKIRLGDKMLASESKRVAPNETRFTTIKPAELVQVDELLDEEDDEVLSTSNTAPRPTGVRS
jgi:hypothetical protein